MIGKRMVGLEPLNATARWDIQNAVDAWERAAICYLPPYEDRWRTWVTRDAYDKINAALEKRYTRVRLAVHQTLR